MKNCLFFLAISLCVLTTRGQVTLSFCTYVNSLDHECVFENTKFITTPDSTHCRIFMMVRSADTFGIEKLLFKLYAIDRFGKEVYMSTMTQQVQPDWRSSWQPAIFVSPGKYMVKVYKDIDTMIVEKGFEFYNY